MKAGYRVLLSLTLLAAVTNFGVGCVMTDEFGLRPAGGIPEVEVGQQLQRIAADGWFAGAYAYTRARESETLSLRLGVYDDFLPLYMLPYSAEFPDYQDETNFYTAASVRECYFDARSGAFSAAALTLESLDLREKVLDAQSQTNQAEAQERVNELDTFLFLSAYMAIVAADGACRRALVQTGQVLELDAIGRL